MGMGPFSFLSWIWFRVCWTTWRFRSLGLESRSISLDGGVTTMHCWAQKDNPDDTRPALLLIQGFGGTGMFGWSGQVPAFAKHYRLYVPDLVFFGESTTTATDRTEIFQAECIKKMLDVLKVDQVDVVGTSYGGIVAYYLADKYPKLIRKVVVASSGVMMVPTTNDRLTELVGVSSVKEILVPKDLKHFRLGMSVATVWRLWLMPDFVLQDMYDWFSKENREEKMELIDGMISGSKGAPPVPVITQDVLILWGTKDNIFHPDLAEQLKSHLGDKADLVWMEGSGHVPQIEKPSKFSAQVLKFLTST